MALMAMGSGLRSSGGGASAIIEIIRKLGTAKSPVPIGLVADYTGRPESEVRESLRQLSEMNAVSLDEPAGTVRLVD